MQEENLGPLDQERELGSQTSSDELPVFPDIQPSEMTRGRKYNLLETDLQAEESLEALAVRMFQDPEASFYYFTQQGKPANPSLEPGGEIYSNHTEFNFFQHLSERDFIRIQPRQGDDYLWTWQRDYVQQKPRFVRQTLKLSERKLRQLEILERLHLEDFYRQERMRQTYAYDVFFSFGAGDRSHAEPLVAKLEGAGHRVFHSCKDLTPGDDFAEKIRSSLQASKEIWVLLTPESRRSEWVISEWGAAWALQKRIVPILLRCSPSDLPDRLRRLQWVDLHEIDAYIARMNGPKQS